MLTTLAVFNYRSLHDVVLPLGPLNVITGPNGSGKSNLYRALRLLAAAAQDRLIPSLAREGGLVSTLWAGPELVPKFAGESDEPARATLRKKPVAMRLGFAGDEFSYSIELGLPVPTQSMFHLDPEIKRECLWIGAALRPSAMLVDRRGSLARLRDAEGEWQDAPGALAKHDSVLSYFSDPRTAPEVVLLRDTVRSWRFYDQFRADLDAPARGAQVGTRTPVLADDGCDLAAALQTILEEGDAAALCHAVSDAFPRSRVGIENHRGRFELEMDQHGLVRPLAVAELSEGTLRYLLWVAALLSPAPPELLVLNEPETSLHPELIPALARLIIRGAESTQVIVVTHSAPLIDALQQHSNCEPVRLEKIRGATRPIGPDGQPLFAAAWRWPAR